MEITLIIISTLLGIFGVFIEPTRQRNSKVFKKLNYWGYLVVGLLVIIGVISVIKQSNQEKEALAKEKEEKYLFFRDHQIGPEFFLDIGLKDSTLLDIDMDARFEELFRIREKYPAYYKPSGSKNKVPNPLISDFYSNYMDSASCYSLIKPLAKAKEDLIVFTLSLHAGKSHNVITFFKDGRLSGNFTIETIAEQLREKESKLDYGFRSIRIKGQFENKLNAGALYKSIVDEYEENNILQSQITFRFSKDFNETDTEDILKLIKNISYIRYHISADSESGRYFTIQFKPEITYTKNTINNDLTEIVFPIKLTSLPKETMVY